MDKKERVERTLAFDSPDRPPLCDSFQHAGIIHHYAGVPDRPDWTREEVCAAARNAVDMVQGWGLGPSFKKGEVSVDRHGCTWRTDTWFSEIVKRPFKTADEYARVLEKEIALVKKASPDYPGATQEKSPDDDLVMCSVKSFRDVFSRHKEQLGDTVLMYPDVFPGLDTLYHLGGWELFTDLFMERPGLLEDFIEARCAQQVERAHAIADRQLSPVVEVACDIAHKAGLLVSADFLKRVYFPQVKRIVDAYHEHGMLVFYHSEGDLWKVMDDLVGTCGVDGLNPLEPDSSMDAEAVRLKYPKLILWGGVDNSHLLVEGTPGQVTERVEQLLELGRQGGLFIGTTGQIHPACKKENLIAMFETVWRSAGNAC